MKAVGIVAKYGPLCQTLQALPETDGAKQARLRRLCERKPTGKLQCPDWLHQEWKNPANRQSLVEKFEATNWNKDWGCMLHVFFLVGLVGNGSTVVWTCASLGCLHPGDDSTAWTQQPKETWDHKGMVFRVRYERWAWMETDTRQNYICPIWTQT